jgi:hypothetical protein
MNGDDIATLVAKWFAEQEQIVSVQQPRSEHLDRLLGAHYSPANAMVSGLAGLLCLIRLVDQRNDLKPILVVPLESSDVLDIRIPSVEELQAQRTPEPPGLYIVARDVARYWHLAEDYRAPFQQEIVPKAPCGEIKAYYRCFRGPEALANNWEYARCVYFEYYPHGLIL